MSLRITSRATSVFVILALPNCSGCTNPSPSHDLDPDAVYTTGAARDDLEHRYGAGPLVYCRDTVPADDFAAASVRALVATGRPRPTAYQVFTRRNPADGGLYRDYVFYDAAQSVLHVARRRE